MAETTPVLIAICESKYQVVWLWKIEIFAGKVLAWKFDTPNLELQREI